MTSTTTLAPEFWGTLESLRHYSRLVLGAIEADDVDEIESLTRAAERMIESIRPTIEARLAENLDDEESRCLAVSLRDLKMLNDRIIEELEIKRREAAARLGMVRERKLRLVHYRPETSFEPELVDRPS